MTDKDTVSLRDQIALLLLRDFTPQQLADYFRALEARSRNGGE